jgi:hypothetical protein
MADHLTTTSRAAASRPNDRVPYRARGLLWCGAAAGPLYVVVGLIEALTRPGSSWRTTTSVC